MKRTILYKGLLTIAIFSLAACKKWVEVPAPTMSINAGNVYQNDVTAEQALSGIYSKWESQNLGNGGSYVSNDLTYFAGLSADEYNYQSPSTGGVLNYYQNQLTAQNGTSYWGDAYSFIQTCNAIIIGTEASTTLTPSVKNNVLGQAKFLRAFFYFYLVNLYGDVPLITGTDYKVNRVARREKAAVIYNQIIADLKDAESLLPDTYTAYDGVTATNERTLPNVWAAKALLARTYLYEKDYADAAAKATEVIGNPVLFNIVSLDSVFLKNSQEAIWQLQPVNSGWNTPEAQFFIIPATGFSDSQPVAMSSSLLNAFEPGDQRKVKWTGTFADQNATPAVLYTYVYKYQSDTQNAPVTEYTNVLRLSELYLIRAEARANLSETNAVADLNAIRQRAGLAVYAGATDQSSLLHAIYHERQVELFGEWGHRWLDLKRTGTVDAVMSVAAPQKGGSWRSYQQLYPVPAGDIILDANLTQNPGY